MLDKVIKSAFRDAGLGVPRRLPLGELMLLVTLFAALFRLLTLVDAPAEVILYIACFTVGVAVCQAMMFDGRRPRDASMIAGTILCPAIFLVAYVLFRLGWVQDHANSAVEFVALFTVFTLLGPVLGYFAGLFVAGWFFAFDYCRARFTGAARRSDDNLMKVKAPSDPANDLTPTSPLESDGQPIWVRRVASHLWPIRPSQPIRGAFGALLSATLFCLVLAPLFQFGIWNVLCVAVIVLTAAFLTGMFQLPWYCFALCVGLSVVASQTARQDIVTTIQDLSLHQLLGIRDGDLPGFAIRCLAGVMGCFVSAMIGWLSLIRFRKATSPKVAVNETTRRGIRWRFVLASIAGGLLVAAAFTFIANRINNSPRASVAKQIAADGGAVEFQPTPPNLTAWPISRGVYVTKNTRDSLSAYFSAYPEGKRTSFISTSQRNLDTASLTPLDGKTIWMLGMLGTQNDHALDNIRDLTANVVYWERSNEEERLLVGDNSLAQLARMPGAQQSLQRLVISHTAVTTIEPIEKFKSLTSLSIRDCPLVSDETRFAAPMPAMQSLHIDDCPITNSDLRRIVAAMPNLTSLSLVGTKVTDEGLVEIAKLKKLTYLDLTRTDVTDDGLVHLEKLKLDTLDLEETKVSEGASNALSRKLDIRVDWEPRKEE